MRMETPKLPVFVLTLAAAAFCQTTPTADQPPSTTPTLSATLDGGRAVVFQTPLQSCETNDIPDAMARAFRDSSGIIHFITASTDLYQDLGPTLETLKRSCDAAYRSQNDTNPADFNDQAWLDSFYTLDGTKVAALTHTEYHGWAIKGECNVQGNNQYSACEYDSDTYHQSNDGGYHFESFKAPNNLVAEIPYKYEIGHGPAGYSVDTNIVELNGWYYAVTTSWTWPPNCSGTTGSNRCITSGGAPIRTQDVFDPSSWRGWSGTDFSVSFVDPYPAPVSHPEEHVFAPVTYMGFVNGLNLYQINNDPSNTIAVATLWDGWDNELGAPGLYLTTSADLINWTTPQLVLTASEISAKEPKGSFTYAYFSLIDPSATDLNFSVVRNHPYLYYVRINNNNILERIVFRQRLTLTANQ